MRAPADTRDTVLRQGSHEFVAGLPLFCHKRTCMVAAGCQSLPWRSQLTTPQRFLCQRMAPSWRQTSRPGKGDASITNSTIHVLHTFQLHTTYAPPYCLVSQPLLLHFASLSGMLIVCCCCCSGIASQNRLILLFNQIVCGYSSCRSERFRDAGAAIGAPGGQGGAEWVAKPAQRGGGPSSLLAAAVSSDGR